MRWVFLTKHRMCGINFDVIHSSLKMLELKNVCIRYHRAFSSLFVFMWVNYPTIQRTNSILDRGGHHCPAGTVFGSKGCCLLFFAGGQLQKFCLRWDLEQLAFIRKSGVYNKLYIWKNLRPKTVLKPFSKWMQKKSKYYWKKTIWLAA